MGNMNYRITDHGSDDEAKKERRRRRRELTKRSISVLPTMFTLGNALCGFAAIYIASRNIDPATLPMKWSPLTFGAMFIFLGMLLDGLDGRVARMTNSTSDLGEQLDSMSDMVTFGVAPAFLGVQMVGIGVPFFGPAADDSLFGRIALLVALIYVACAALRLARFNIEIEDEEPDHTSFKGLPSPGAAGTVASMVLLHEHFLKHTEQSWIIALTAGIMVFVMLASAVGMVSTFKYVHVMNKYVKGRASFTAIAYTMVVVLLLFISLQLALSVAFVTYALSAPTLYYFKKLFQPEKAKDLIVPDIPLEEDQNNDRDAV